MNPLKCVFSLTSNKFLGYIVWYHDIEVDQSKIAAICQSQGIFKSSKAFKDVLLLFDGLYKPCKTMSNLQPTYE